MVSDPSPPPSNLDPLDPLGPFAHEVAQTLARVASDVALVIDRDGVIREVAEGGGGLPCGFGTWVGRRWVDTASADTRRKIELLLEEIHTSGVTQRREVNHPNTEGDDLPVAWTAIRLGAAGPVVAVGRDLRAVAAIQRRFLDAQHEMELDYWQRRHADNRYRLLFQVASDAVLVLDAATLEVLESNEAARLLQGASDQRLLNAWLPAAAQAAVVELLATARASGKASEIRVRLDGAGGALDVSATPFRAGERRQLLLRLRRDEARSGIESTPAMMRALVESTPDAVVVSDSAGRIQAANPAFVALVAQGNEAHLRGQSLFDVVQDAAGNPAGSPASEWRELVQRVRNQGLCGRTPLRVRHGALEVAVEVSATLLAESEQELLGFVVRSVEPSTTSAQPAGLDRWPELSALQAQVGLVPLATLLRDATLAVERELLRSGMRLASGQVGTAARLLMIDAQALTERIQQLGLAGADEDNGPPSTPAALN